MQRLRNSIDANEVQNFLTEFLNEQFSLSELIPQWIKNALDYAGYTYPQLKESL